MKKKSDHYLQELIDFLKLNPKSFSNSLGHNRADKVYHILNGRNGISTDLANEICNIYSNISYDWLLTGEGSMLKNEYSIEHRFTALLSFLHINQEKFEKSTGIWRGAIHNIKNGFSDVELASISETYPDLNIDWLVNGNGDMWQNKSTATPVPMAENTLYLTLPNGIEYYRIAEGYYRMVVPFVPVQAYAKYVDEHRDAEYSEAGTYEFIVDEIYPNGDYKAFEIKGDSMDNDSRYGLIDKDVVLAKELSKDLWQYPLHINDRPNWIIILNGTIVCKQIISHNTETGDIVCHSLNPSPAFSDFSINLNDVHQLYYVIRVHRSFRG